MWRSMSDLSLTREEFATIEKGRNLFSNPFSVDVEGVQKDVQ